MKKNFARKVFSYLFLMIFCTKMVISVAPLVASHLDSKFMNTVIMQLEIETQNSSNSETVKDTLSKGEWLSGISKFNFSLPIESMGNVKFNISEEFKIQTIYPNVPTQPPNS